MAISSSTLTSGLKFQTCQKTPGYQNKLRKINVLKFDAGHAAAQKSCADGPLYIRKYVYTQSYLVIMMSHELDLHIDELREISEDNPQEMEVVIEMMMEAGEELENDVTIE